MNFLIFSLIVFFFFLSAAAAHMHLSGGSDDDGDHENCFGLTVKKKLQMEISDGTTPPPCLPSLNMSPISFSDSGKGI